jgi:hypothetical protein
MAGGNLHKCDNVLVDFQGVTALAFVFTSIGLEHEGHEVLALALLVNLAVSDNVLGEVSDRVGDGTLCLNSLEREGGDPGEQPQHEHGNKGRMFTAHLILSPPRLGDFDGIGSVTDGIEVVTKSDATDDVHGGTGGIFDDVELDRRIAGRMDLVGNAGLESGGDVVDVGVHCSDVFSGESGGNERTHAPVVLLTLDPDEGAAAEAEDEGTEDGRVGVIVRVLAVDVREPDGVAHDQLYVPQSAQHIWRTVAGCRVGCRVGVRVRVRVQDSLCPSGPRRP